MHTPIGIDTDMQGGIRPEGGWTFGDGHYPYNPSPFKGYIDARKLRPGELEKLDEMLKK